jgi:hypothetical protein
MSTPRPPATPTRLPDQPTAWAACLDIILDDGSSAAATHAALDALADILSATSGITPDRSFDGWREDTRLDSGVAINPQAAAFCIKDYHRSVMFMRGVCAALELLQASMRDQPVRVLYAGCGPFALLLLPLLGKLAPGRLEIHFLDIHQHSLDSVAHLLVQLSLDQHNVNFIQADACHYQHHEKLHLIIAETMQKALEQEPQFAVTANLAPQLCKGGVFIPQKISVELCLAQLEQEADVFEATGSINPEALVASGKRHVLSKLIALTPESTATLTAQITKDQTCSSQDIELGTARIPAVENLASFDAALFTRIHVFGDYRLQDYDSQISLPAKCYELAPLHAGDVYAVSYQLGSYPRFNLRKIPPTGTG